MNPVPIGEVINLAKEIVKLLDPEKRRKGWELKMDKKTKKALETAEKVFFLVDKEIDRLNQKVLNNDKTFHDFIHKYIDLRKEFFKNE